MPKEEEYFKVSVFLEQIAKVKVKGKSQRDAEDNLRRFCDKLADILDEDKKLLPNIPFEVDEIEHYFLDVIDIGLFPHILTTEKVQPTFNSVLKGSDSELQSLIQSNTSVTKEVIEEVRAEFNSDKDLTNAKDFVKLKGETKKVKLKE